MNGDIFLDKVRPDKPHAVATISFAKDSVTCSCGRTSPVKDWPHAPGLAVARVWGDQGLSAGRYHLSLRPAS